MSSRFQKIPKFASNQRYGGKELENLGSLLCITDLMNQYLRFNEKSLKRQQWGKLGFRESCNLFIPEKRSY